MTVMNKWLIRALFFSQIFLFSFFPIHGAQAATTDFSQSSVSTGIGVLVANILALIPDPDVAYSSIVAYTSVLPADKNNGATLTNLIRRNTTSATLTDTLFAYMDGSSSDGPPLLYIPIASNSTYTLIFAPQENNTINFYVRPTSDFIWSLGTTLGIKTVTPSSLTALAMTNIEFDNNIGKGISDSSVPFIRFYHSVSSFPSVTGGLPATVIVSEIPVNPTNPTGDHYVAYYSAMVSSSGNPVSPTSGPVNTFLNVGAPSSSGNVSANEMPYLTDLNKDNILDLVLVVNPSGNPVKSDILIMLGNGDGTFGTPVVHEIDNQFIFGISSGDMDGDGTIDLIVSSFETPDAPTQSTINIIKNPLTSFTFIPVLTPSGGAFSTFVHNLDCNVDGSPDIVSVEADISIDKQSDKNTSIQAGNVLCYINDGKGGFSTSSSLVIYPKELLQVSLQTNGNTQSLPNLILQSQVGDIGCGKGWFGDIFYGTGGNNNNNNNGNDKALGFNDVLFAQHSDCNAVIDALNNGGNNLLASGGGCSLSNASTSHSSQLLAFVVLFSFWGFILSKIRKQKTLKNLFSCQRK